VLGVSGLIVILGTPSPETALHVFHRAWALMALSGGIAALMGLALGRVRARDAEPAPPEAGFVPESV
jgi:hypothetical protein